VDGRRLTAGEFRERYVSEMQAYRSAERDVFKGLLERSVNELWDLISGRVEPPPGPVAGLVGLLRRP
jgi:succinate dehydrogenase flavin-adding protein (antitoxin of CptAB toxin-antitoxin module)